MSLTSAQRLDRLKVRLAELQFWRARETLDLDGWRFEGEPIALGEAWPRREGPVRFTATAEVPAHWPLDEARLTLNVGGESLLTLTGDGQTRRYGLDPYHEEFPLPAREVAIETESVPRLPFGEPVRAPRLNRASLIWLDPAVDRLWLLLTQVAEAAEVLGEHEVVPHLLAAAEASLRGLDWPSATADYIARVAPARQQQRIWQLPELIAAPAPHKKAQRPTTVAPMERLTQELRALQQRVDRIKVRLEELACWREREAIPIGGWTIDGAPIAGGQAWPDRDGVKAFAASAAVPAGWAIPETRLVLDLGGEGLVSLSYEDGEAVRFGNDPYHREFPVRARSFSIASETVARLPFGEPVRDPHLNQARLIWLDIVVDALAMRLQLVAETAAVLGDHEVVPHLLAAAEEAFYALDWPSASRDYVARTASMASQQRIWQLPALREVPTPLSEDQRLSVGNADARLIERLRDLRGRFPPQGRIALTGHAHIDLAWLWPYAETRRKMRRTFSTAVALMEGSNAYLARSGFRFNQSTAQYYAQIEEDDPALFEAINAKVKAGAWETIGGMWVEPDTNMPNGESLARQLLYGQRYFEQKFGVRHDVCWLPDCFGFSGALPQLLRQAGIASFFTIKVNWSETNHLPADLFWWEGLDGSRVLAHSFDNPRGGYNGVLGPEALLSTWRNFRSKAQHPTTLLAIGHGDGGGGVTPEFVAREMQLRDFPVLPAARWGRVADFFAEAHKSAETGEFPVWQGEIYLELHRATLTTQSAVKKAHRQAERALITAETLGSLAAMLGAELPESLEHIWRVVL
jgi:alpha-mannosidase